jgi:acetyl esterase/lipase
VVTFGVKLEGQQPGGFPATTKVLMIQGTGDDLSPGTAEYARRLDEVHARHEVILLEKAPHGMENWEGHSVWMFYKQKMVEWLEKTLSPQ